MLLKQERKVVIQEIGYTGAWRNKNATGDVLMIAEMWKPTHWSWNKWHYVYGALMLGTIGFIRAFYYLLGGYKQVGTFKVERPHSFKEYDEVEVSLTSGKITGVKKVGD